MLQFSSERAGERTTQWHSDYVFADGETEPLEAASPSFFLFFPSVSLSSCQLSSHRYYGLMWVADMQLSPINQTNTAPICNIALQLGHPILSLFLPPPHLTPPPLSLSLSLTAFFSPSPMSVSLCLLFFCTSPVLLLSLIHI